MFVVEDENKLTHDGAPRLRMWAAALDEAYGNKPYAELNLKLGKNVWKHKVPLDDVAIVARMLRHIAGDLDQIAVAGNARRAHKDQ